MRLYAALASERASRSAFHSGFHWGDESMKQRQSLHLDARDLVRAISTSIHLTNWIINGLPERFPKLKVMWIESGLAWVPFLMQRLDSRIHDARLGGAAAQAPAERVHAATCSSPGSRWRRTQPQADSKATFEAINAETQLLFASDWPHWDFDLPSSITDLPFLDEQAKRNILGLNAAKLFNLEVPKHKMTGVKTRKAPTTRVPVTA